MPPAAPPRVPLAAFFAAVSQETTGVVHLRGAESAAAPWRVRLELVRGWIHALLVEHDGPTDADAPPPSLPGDLLVGDTALRLSRLIAALIHRRLLVETIDEPRRRAGPVAPFHPLGSLRRAIAALAAERLDAADALVEARVLGVRLSLLAPLHGSGVDPDERALVTVLAAPRGWDELSTRARRPRLLRLLRDTALLGVLDGAGTLGDELHAILAEPGEARRRAYREEARALHPDLHPEDDDEARRVRTARMAELAARHRRGE